MAHLYDPYYAVGNLVVGLAYVGAGALVLAGGGAARRTNRALALMLVAFGLVPFLAGIVQLNIDADLDRPASWLGWNAGFYTRLLTGIIWVPYLIFLGVALPSPLVAPLRPRAVQSALLLACGALVAAVMLRPSLLLDLDGPTPGWGPLGVAYAIFYPWAIMGTALYATVAALDAVRRSPAGTATRRRARAYATAFIVHDLAMLTWAIGSFIEAEEISQVFTEVIGNAIGLVFVALLVRALLREQLFDFELRVKTGVRRTTLAAIFLAAFFVVAQVVQVYTSTAFGLLGGAIVAGLLLFAMHPLQRAAERVASAAVPGAQPTPAYLSFKKLEVYRAQVESSLADDGRIDERERRFLEKLRANLGIAAEDAAAIEQDATAARAA